MNTKHETIGVREHQRQGDIHTLKTKCRLETRGGNLNREDNERLIRARIVSFTPEYIKENFSAVNRKYIGDNMTTAYQDFCDLVDQIASER